jgi:hypothetical protein
MRFSTSVVLVVAAVLLPASLPAQQTITGQAAFADWSQQQPGVRLQFGRQRKRARSDVAQPLV